MENRFSWLVKPVYSCFIFRNITHNSHAHALLCTNHFCAIGENPYLEISGQFQPITCQQEDEGFINFNPTKTGQTSLSRRHVRPLDFQTGFGKLQIRFLKQVIFGKRQTMIRGDTSWPQMQHATVEDELQTVIDFLENIGMNFLARF